ncbi:class I SAM-dependent methyltransferase [Streptomyces sp. NPDC001970]
MKSSRPRCSPSSAVFSGLTAAAPVADRFVTADLEGDWDDALTAHGFDKDRPTAWAIDGASSICLRRRNGV